MLQVKSPPNGPLKIKSIRRVVEPVSLPSAASCSLEPGDGTDKPPC